MRSREGTVVSRGGRTGLCPFGSALVAAASCLGHNFLEDMPEETRQANLKALAGMSRFIGDTIGTTVDSRW